MERNPNYRGEPYPCEGMPGDKAAGLLDDCGKKMPFVDTLVFDGREGGAAAERDKFRQGYLDVPEFERTEYGRRVPASTMRRFGRGARRLRAQGLQASRSTPTSPAGIIGFNWLDPVVGEGDTPEQQERNRKLRQAHRRSRSTGTSTTQIFPKKGGETAMSPLPAGIFGSRDGTPEGVNPVTHRVVDGKLVRRPIDDAKKLLVEAGYPDGRDAKTGRPLVLNYDYQRAPTPERKSEIDWMVKQFAKIGIQLEVRATDYNQFQDKMRKGKHQVFWLRLARRLPGRRELPVPALRAELEEPSPTARTPRTTRTPSTTSCSQQLKTLDDGPREAEASSTRWSTIVQQDAPWAFGFFPYASGGVPAVGAQRQAGDPGPRPWRSTYRIDSGARAQAGRVEQAGAGGRSVLIALALLADRLASAGARAGGASA